MPELCPDSANGKRADHPRLLVFGLLLYPVALDLYGVRDPCRVGEGDDHAPSLRGEGGLVERQVAGGRGGQAEAGGCVASVLGLFAATATAVESAVTSGVPVAAVTSAVVGIVVTAPRGSGAQAASATEAKGSLIRRDVRARTPAGSAAQ
jgi:hypothetical protein